MIGSRVCQRLQLKMEPLINLMDQLQLCVSQWGRKRNRRAEGGVTEGGVNCRHLLIISHDVQDGQRGQRREGTEWTGLFRLEFLICWVNIYLRFFSIIQFLNLKILIGEIRKKNLLRSCSCSHLGFLFIYIQGWISVQRIFRWPSNSREQNHRLLLTKGNQQNRWTKQVLVLHCNAEVHHRLDLTVPLSATLTHKVPLSITEPPFLAHCSWLLHPDSPPWSRFHFRPLIRSVKG